MTKKFCRIFCLASALLLQAHAASAQTAAKSAEDDYSVDMSARILGYVWGTCVHEQYGEQSKVLPDLDRAWEEALRLCEQEKAVMQRFLTRAGASSAEVDAVIKESIDGLTKARAEMLKNYNEQHN